MPDFDILVHQDLRDLVKDRLDQARISPELIWPWRRAHPVSVLLVTDGALDFGDGDFGLSTVITSLLDDGRRYVRFDLTLAHLRADATPAMMLDRETRITRRITGFRFDVASHFTPTTFDEVWLVGFESYYHYSVYGTRGNPANGYPANRLSDAELDRLTAHMNDGRGVFATGDHGMLGAGLCGSVDRVRDMRYWADYGPGADNLSGPGQVSMGGVNRNDSNAAGHDTGFQFSDQSDDVPQQLDLTLYHSPIGLFREERYPHPVLCSPLGRIDVFPDHPHEGEVKVPGNLGLSCRDGSPEYPPPTSGSTPVVPEIIARGHVSAGNRASSLNGPGNKLPTVAHGFDVLAAYDGHRAGVGRVVTDSTWHHLVNVNLIGIYEGAGFDDFGRPGEHPSKHTGFLYSAAGREHLAKIRHYFVNTAVWLATQESVDAMNAVLWWDVVWNDRVVEATTLNPGSTIKDVSLVDLWHIGSQARDVLGRRATVCRTTHLVISVFEKVWVEFVPWVNPWDPVTDLDVPVIPWFDPAPLLDIALGGAVVALRDAFPYPTDKAPELRGQAEEVVLAGASYALSQAVGRLDRDLRLVRAMTKSGAARFGDAQAPEPQPQEPQRPARSRKTTTKATKAAKKTATKASAKGRPKKA